MNVLEIEFHGGVLHLNGRPAADWVAEVYRLRAAGEKARAALSELLMTRDPKVYSDALRALDEALGPN